MAKIEVELLPAQLEFVRSKARNTGFVGGYGSGKTMAGVVKMLLWKLANRGVNGAYYFPTFSLLNMIALPRFLELGSAWGLNLKVNKNEKFVEVYNGGVNYGRIYLRNMSEPDTIVGYEVGYSVIDEADILGVNKMEEVWKKVVARNRAKTKEGVNRVDLLGTPEGFGFMYNFFVRDEKPYKKLVRGRTYDNPFLPDGYVETLLSEFNEKEVRAYLEGEFVNLKGDRVFYSFDREEHVTDKRLEDFRKVFVGMDFNVGKMSAVIYGEEGGVYYAVDELTGLFDTYQMIDALKEMLDGKSVVIYPDASAKNRRTGGYDDVTILRRAGFNVRVLDRNPRVSTRVAVFNRLLERGKIKVNTARCEMFTEALEKLIWKEGGVMDKSTGLDHVADAGTYPIYTLEGVGRVKISV